MKALLLGLMGGLLLGSCGSAQTPAEAARAVLKEAGAEVVDCARVGEYPLASLEAVRKPITSGLYATSFKTEWQVCAVTRLEPQAWQRALEATIQQKYADRLEAARPQAGWELLNQCFCQQSFYTYKPDVRITVEFHSFARQGSGVIEDLPGGFIRVYEPSGSR